jgi:hypothetical protein
VEVTLGLIGFKTLGNVLVERVKLVEEYFDEARLDDFCDAHCRNDLGILKLILEDVEQQSQAFGEHEVGVFFVSVFKRKLCKLGWTRKKGLPMIPP